MPLPTPPDATADALRAPTRGPPLLRCRYQPRLRPLTGRQPHTYAFSTPQRIPLIPPPSPLQRLLLTEHRSAGRLSASTDHPDRRAHPRIYSIHPATHGIAPTARQHAPPPIRCEHNRRPSRHPGDHEKLTDHTALLTKAQPRNSATSRAESRRGAARKTRWASRALGGRTCSSPNPGRTRRRAESAFAWADRRTPVAEASTSREGGARAAPTMSRWPWPDRGRPSRQIGSGSAVNRPQASRAAGECSHAKAIVRPGQSWRSLSRQSASPPSTRTYLPECLLDPASRTISKRLVDSRFSRAAASRRAGVPAPLRLQQLR